MIASSTVINTIAYSLNRPRRDISSSAIGTFPARGPAKSKRASRERENETSGALKRVQIITNTSRSSHLNYKERTRTREPGEKRKIPTTILRGYTASRLQARSTIATLTATPAWIFESARVRRPISGRRAAVRTGAPLIAERLLRRRAAFRRCTIRSLHVFVKRDSP